MERLDERGIEHSGVKDRGFMDSIYFKDPLGLLIELASYRFEPPAGHTHTDVLFEAHLIRVERGDREHRPRPRRGRDRGAGRALAALALRGPRAQGAPTTDRRATMPSMRVSAKADYAVRAAMELAATSSAESPVKGTVVSKAQKIPLRFLENILNELRHAGVVQSQRGSEGGYWLARTARRHHGRRDHPGRRGPLASVRGERPEDLEYRGDAEPLRDVWVALRANIRQILESVTLADIVAGKLPAQVNDLVEGHPEVWEPH